MASFLYRVGRFAYTHRLLVIAVWVLLLAGAGASTTLGKPFVADFNLPGTESGRAGELMEQKFPGQSDMDMVASAKVVIQAQDGATLDDPDNIARVDRLTSALRGLAHVAAREMISNPVGDPARAAQVSQDRTIAYIDVTYDKNFIDVQKPEVDAFKQVLQDGRDDGLTVEATGTLLNGQPPMGGAGELLGVGVALIVMIIAFASLIAATLPIVTAVFGVGVAMAGITGASAFMSMDPSSLMIAAMLGIAVSIDYALFIVSRFRGELNDTDDYAHAAGRAVGTAGSSVVFAGLTVVIALAALSVTGIPMIAMMGYGAAFAVTIAVLSAVTLLPAILGLFGRRAFAVRIKGLRRGDEPDSVPSNGFRWARLVVAHPIPVLLSAIAVLGLLAIPVTKLELGLELASGDQKKAVQLIGEGFGEGITGPLMVAVSADESTDPPQAYNQLMDALRGQDNVLMVTPPRVNADGTGALIMVIPKSGPASPDTHALMQEIRDLQPGFNARSGIEFGVTGQTAMISDLSAALLKALIPYLTVAIGLAFLVLMLVFRSVLVPLTATLGFLLSIGATFGATVAIFQLGWFGLVKDPVPIISFLPVMLIALVFGLAMDYQVFLVTRMREEYVHGPRTREGAKSAVIVGFQHGGRVVTSAAIIMISVFSAFMLSPETIAKSMGFALAAAVLFDAFIVRMAVIPAVMSLLGTSAWYLPRWLDRILPNVDIEGERLKDLHAEVPASQVPQLVPAGNGMQRVQVAAGKSSGRHRL